MRRPMIARAARPMIARAARPMMARAARLLAAAALLAATAGTANARCTSAADQAAFDVGALKSELTVMGIACGLDEDYNAFVVRDRTELNREDAVVNAWFKKTFGRTAQARYDSYITLLANEQSTRNQHEGSELCPRLRSMFSEAALIPVVQLPQYAAAKDVFPLDMACEVSASPGPAPTTSRSAPRSRTTTRH